jgi:hypothetical protein
MRMDGVFGMLVSVRDFFARCFVVQLVGDVDLSGDVLVVLFGVLSGGMCIVGYDVHSNRL